MAMIEQELASASADIKGSTMQHTAYKDLVEGVCTPLSFHDTV